MKKRILSLLLCIVMCLSLMPMSAFAEENFEFRKLPTTGVENITVPAGDYYTGVAAKEAFIHYWGENIKTDGDFILIDYFYTYNNGYHSWMITIENGVAVATDGGFAEYYTTLDLINNMYASYDKWVNGTYSAIHTHNLVKVDGQPATEEASGWKDYYECKDSADACHKYFEDSNGNTSITNLEEWKAEGGNGYIAKLNVPKYGITVSNDGNGTASASVSEAASGTNVTLTATPSSGYVFDAWEVISGGITISGNAFTMPASEISITAHFKKKSSPSPTPDPKPTPDPNPRPAPSPDPTQSDNSVKEPEEPLLRNYNGNKTIAKAGKNDNEAESEIGGICYMVQQGPLCNAAFAAATPTGFKEAFTFNFSLDTSIYHKTNYDRKRGLFLLNIPKNYQKKGRTFRIIGINKNGQTKVFSDSDMDDDTFTTALDVEGYAFSLIYTDSTVKTEKAVTKGSSSSQNDN